MRLRAGLRGAVAARRSLGRARRAAAAVEAAVDEFEAPRVVAVDQPLIVRRDELPAYHLAVVVDDAAQGITNVVRGVDLLDSTPVHCHLQRALKLPTPQYCHLPVIVNAQGQKLSKQTGARAVTALEPGVAADVLRWLGLAVPNELTRERPRVLWQWAIERWDPARLRGIRAIPKV